MCARCVFVDKGGKELSGHNSVLAVVDNGKSSIDLFLLFIIIIEIKDLYN